MKFLVPSLLLSAALIFPGEALAHKKVHHHHHHHFDPHYPAPAFGLHCYNGDCTFRAFGYRPRVRRRVRISEDCVYKPYKDKVVCKY